MATSPTVRSFSAGSGATIALAGAEEIAQTLCLHVTAVSGATITVKGALDDSATNGSNQQTLLMIPVGSATGVTSATAVGMWRVDITGIPFVFLTSTAGTCSGFWTTAQG